MNVSKISADLSAALSADASADALAIINISGISPQRKLGSLQNLKLKLIR